MRAAPSERPSGRPAILVTGAAGFVGRHLVARLVAAGAYELVSVDRQARAPSEGELFVRGDLAEPLVYDSLPEVDVVYHIAAQSSARVSHEAPFDELRDNVAATVRLLEYCRRVGVRKVVFTSSMAVYGEAEDGQPLAEDGPLRPMSIYGVDKLAGELYLQAYRQFGLTHTVFRLFNVYGPYQNMDNLKQGMVSIYLRYIHDGVELPVTGALMRYRDFVFVDDVVDALELGLHDPATDNATFNVGTGRKTTVGELIDVIATEYGYAPGAYPVRPVGGHPGDVFGSVAAIGKLAALGWKPRYSLREGVARMVAWWQGTRPAGHRP